MTQPDLFDVGERTTLFAETVSKKRQPCTPAPVGSGPPAETCRTCLHYTIVEYANKYRKCGLMRAVWTGGPGTDIKASWPACRMWEEAE